LWIGLFKISRETTAGKTTQIEPCLNQQKRAKQNEKIMKLSDYISIENREIKLLKRFV